MNAAWASVIAAAITAVVAAVVAAWARRGQKVVDVSTVAMNMVEELGGRVRRLEDVESWRQIVSAIDSDHISVLRDWIFRNAPPPPPDRPVYPPRPA